MVKLLLMLALCFEHARLIIPIVEIMKSGSATKSADKNCLGADMLSAIRSSALIRLGSWELKNLRPYSVSCKFKIRHLHIERKTASAFGPVAVYVRPQNRERLLGCL